MNITALAKRIQGVQINSAADGTIAVDIEIDEIEADDLIFQILRRTHNPELTVAELIKRFPNLFKIAAA